MPQTCTSTRKKNNKKTQFPTTTQKWGHSSWKFCFFWCLSMFSSTSTIFLAACAGLVHLVVLFFFVACQCFVKSESPSLHRHQNKQSRSGGNFDRHQKKHPGTMAPLLGSCCFFVFAHVFAYVMSRS